MAKIETKKLTDLIPDDKNFNRGTETGKAMISKSLQRFGAGRSLLIDKNNRIIAGNKTHENAEELGMEDVIVVETDGKKLVAVKRTDIDLDSKEGREMALADNATVKIDLQWDDDVLSEVSEDFGIDLEEWGVYDLKEWENLDYIEEEQEDPSLVKKAQIVIKLSEQEDYDDILDIVKNALEGRKVTIT